MGPLYGKPKAPLIYDFHLLLGAILTAEILTIAGKLLSQKIVNSGCVYTEIAIAVKFAQIRTHYVST